MSEPEYEIVASVKLPIRVRALGVITSALSKEYGPDLCMEQNGQTMEFKRTVEKKAEAAKNGQND